MINKAKWLFCGLYISTMPVYAITDCTPPTSIINKHYDSGPANERNKCLKKSINKKPDYQMLVYSWSPGFCDSMRGQDGNIPERLTFQCDSNIGFKWVVHGLWGQLNEPETCSNGNKPIPLHPRYCKGDLPALPDNLILKYMCIQPGESLLQGEWEKHGACSFDTAEEYFNKIKSLHQSLTLPEEGLTPPTIFQWMKDHNPALKNHKLGFDNNTHELRICYSNTWDVINCPD